MWDSLVDSHDSIESIMNDKGLAQIGDNLVNFCYSLAKSVVLDKMQGEKVRDSVLARAIRATPVYQYMGRRTDIGKAADAYEALMAWLWMKKIIDIPFIVDFLTKHLEINSKTNRKEEGEIAALAFQKLLERLSLNLPPSNSK
ncbi:MAG: ribonuclease III family protein [Candidatus Thorarchaeota archaeon]